MGIAERRRREREERRHAIVDAAEAVFFSSGWEDATMDAVAERAELAKATLYLYFKSKEELYAAVLLRGSRIMYDMFRDAATAHERGIDRVEAIGRAYIRFAHEHPDYFHAMMHFGARPRDIVEMGECERECEEVGQQTIGAVAGAVQSGIDDGTIRSDLDPVQTAIILWAQTTGMLQILSVKGEHLDSVHRLSPDDLMQSYFAFVERALRSD
jgi:AcrR family transcriptional regulator